MDTHAIIAHVKELKMWHKGAMLHLLKIMKPWENIDKQKGMDVDLELWATHVVH